MTVSQTELLNNRTARPVPLTRMGFGGAPLGNLYRKVSDEDAQAALQAAYDAGIRFFDTAPQYGLGRSEQRFGQAISRFGRENIQLSTKIGRLLLDCEPHEVTPEAFVDVPQKRIVFDYTYDGVMRSYEASRDRIGVANSDILLVHDVCVFSQGSQEVSDAKVRELFDGGGYKALTELRDAGEIAAIGAGVNEWQVCEKLLGLGDFDGFLLAGRYTLLEQEALDSFLPLCEQRDVGIILGGPYNSGILATGAVPGAKYNYADAPEDILERVRKIEAVCAAHDTPLIAAALQFVLGHPCVKTVVPGAVNASEVQSNVALMERDIPPGLWSDLRSEGLIRSDAPLPSEAANAA
ncbi:MULTISPECIES: aldo/keto reductase [unclassified Ruegeria]|uniref:aldo/keto reductase n=1 Tax=unclassified Ruegeria TaxID=2625375 RepID=UPI001489841D|nr:MULTISPECIES: aldo/keto reductase [unclassified Ruegeria]NOD64858.1 aldo/keto reductase [Ruegeria sp. HKCCD6109]NOD77628.1 aldo/keto reductase [Ruegeria sp. HKCCD4332]NOD89832.1 aldo/keto reductase [Ruegeria sp. HKCCD4318]NOE14722.1 aldo/keto reductase [Ruegeria sp. HKCCD4318-2]NOG10924.1 aldo/keto reductase [Ruegeria sp. HKCCD4315]